MKTLNFRKTILFAVLSVFAVGVSLSFPVLSDAQTPQVPEISLRDKIDQMLMIGFRGTTFAKSPELSGVLKNSNLGGVILFDYDTPSKKYVRNIVTPKQIKTLIAAAQKNAKTPLFVAVDEEGGAVTRLKKSYGFTTMLPSHEILAKSSVLSVQKKVATHAAVMQDLGFNIDFAPTVDILNPANPAIGKYGRSFGADTDTIISYASAFARGLSLKGIAPVIKHYPGQGSTLVDTHKAAADSSATFSRTEEIPFTKMLANSSLSVMVSHIVVSDISTEPASLSKEHIDRLRAIPGFQGLVFSDDYDMGAIRKGYPLDTLVAKAVNAGVDVLIFSNNIGAYNPNEFYEVREAIERGVASGIIPKEKIDAAYARIMEFKKEKGIMK